MTGTTGRSGSLRRQRLLAALARRVEAVEARPSGDWRIALRNGRPFGATVRLDDGWVEIEAELGAAPAARFARLLELNHTLPPGVKLVLSAQTRRVVVRAEAPLEVVCEAQHALEPQIAQACDRVEAAVNLACCAAREGGTGPAEGAGIAPASWGVTEAVALCAEAGWECAERTPGRWVVSLGAGGEATLSSAGDAVRAQVDLGRWEGGGDEVVERAAAGLLLAASGVVRLARAAVTGGRENPRATLEVLVEPAASPSDLGHALSALDLAARTVAAEWRLVHDARVARHYAAVCGWDQDPGREADAPQARGVCPTRSGVADARVTAEGQATQTKEGDQ